MGAADSGVPFAAVAKVQSLKAAFDARLNMPTSFAKHLALIDFLSLIPGI
jgi:hypothetical protein